ARLSAGGSTGGSSSSPAPSSFAVGGERNGALRTTASRRTERAVLAPAALFAFLSNVPARGVEIEEVVFEDRVRVHGLPLVVAHTGLMRWKIVFRGSVAALYLGEGVSPDDWSVDVPKRLEIVYFWAIDGKAFGRTGDEILAHNVSAEELARLHPRRRPP